MTSQVEKVNTSDPGVFFLYITRCKACTFGLIFKWKKNIISLKKIKIRYKTSAEKFNSGTDDFN